MISDKVFALTYTPVLKLQIALVLIFTFVLALPAFCQQPPTPEALLAAVDKSADLSAAGPYTLTATVDANKQTGQLRIDRDHDRFRVELDMPGYQEVRLTLGDKRYVPLGKANLFVTGLYNFDRSWDPLKEDLVPQPVKKTYSKFSNKNIHDRKALCFEQTSAHEKPFSNRETRYCIDPDRSVLLREDGGDDRNEFFDYTPIAGHMLPRRVTIHKASLTDLELRDISVSYRPVDPARFAIPEQSIELQTCKAGGQFPTPLSTPEPQYTSQARAEHNHPTIVLHAFIATDGTVEDPLVMTPTRDGLDRNAVKAVRTWKFKPATCSGRPVMQEMTIEVSFRLG